MGHGPELSGIAGRIKDKFKRATTERVRAKFEIPGDAKRNISSFIKLSRPTTGGFPTELLPLGASMWSGFILTPFAQQQMEGWVLPFWLVRQTTPSSGSFVPHGHQFLYSNLTHRNWTGVGLSGFPNEGVVDPRGLVTPWPFAPSVDLWIMCGGELACPSRMDEVEQRLIDDLPIVRTSFDAFGLKCEWTTFVAPLDGMPVLLSLATLSNPGEGAVEAGIVLSVRPYNTESICAINTLAYEPSPRVFSTDGNLLLYLPEEPDRVIVSDYVHGDAALVLTDPGRESPPEGTLEVAEPLGLATGAAVYDRRIEPGGEAAVCFACPLTAGISPPLQELLPGDKAVASVKRHRDVAARTWAETSLAGTRVTVAEERYRKAFDVNKAFLLLMYDGHSITPGVSTYHMMWFRDAAYLVPALERMGHPEKARLILSTYPDRQTSDGFFRSHNGEWDSNGQAMWTLVNHYRMTGDIDFLKGVYPSLMKGARWIDSMRQKDLPAGDPRHGLLPAGISAEHFGISDCYYWDDIWSVGGLEAGALAAGVLGFEADALYMKGVAADLTRDMEASWEKVKKRLGRAVMPIAPSRDVDAASIGALAAVYPLDLIPPESEIMENTVGEIVERCFYKDTHYHGIMHCGINPYLSMHVAQYFLRRRDPRALKIFESLWSMATDTYTYPEAINPLTGGGAIGDGHDGWSAGDIFNFVRNLFVMEEGGRLALLALGKKEWFAGGEEIVVERAPTYFGEVSYSVASEADRVAFSLPGGFDRPPAAVELSVPFPVVSCEVDGKPVKLGRTARSVEVAPSAREAVFKIKR